MKKSSAIRLAGFVGALCASGALIATAVSGTGAYFTDSHPGEIDASTGQISVDVSPSNGVISFQNLLPGDYQDQTVHFTAHPVGDNGQTEDIWLVFPTDDGSGNNPSEAFTGTAGDPAGGGLGRYGHFAVSSTGGAHFTSYNLNNAGTGIHSGSACSTSSSTGWGGSNQQASSPSDTSVPFCAPPNAILLQSNMANNDNGSATLTFGFTPKLTSQTQYHNLTKIVSYKIVATQHNVRPDDPFNS